MSSPLEIVSEINELISYLTKINLTNDQNFAYPTNQRGAIQVRFAGSEHISSALKNRDYLEIYRTMTMERVYNVKMLDGALIQMSYEFVDTLLQRHRLAFYPSPIFDEFSKNPETYFDDEIDGDIISTNTVPFFFRFDYDSRATTHKQLSHPRSHLSLGKYPNCRIPVTEPMTPRWFIDFILRNFYDTKEHLYTDHLPRNKCSLGESIAHQERNVIHIVIPSSKKNVE